MAIHPTAIIDGKAELDSSVEVGPYCVIEANVRVAAGCALMQNVYLTGWTEIGESCTLHPGVIVGHSPQDIKYDGARTYCRVGRKNILREYVTIHRGTDPESATTVGDGCFFLAGSHVGHNCAVGDNVTLINSAMLAGHVSVGDRVTIGGGAGVHQFVRIGELSMIKGTAAVAMDIIPYALVGTDGRVAGVNTVGLRRAGLSREERQEVRYAYRVLFGKGARFQNAVEQLMDKLITPAGRRLLVFLQTQGKRGFAGGRRKREQTVEGSYPE